MPAPGDLIYADYQYEFRNFLFGSGTDFMTEKVTGLLSSAPVRNLDTDRQADHGAKPGLVLYGKRTIAFDMHILGVAGNDIETKLEAAQRAFQLPRRRTTRTPSEFVYKRPGQEMKLIYARCERRDFTSEYQTAHGHASGSVELVAPDPLIYSLVLNELTITLPPGTASGQMTLWQSGDCEDGAAPEIEITGPATDPTVTNTTDGNRALKTTGAITGLQTFIFNEKKMSATLNGADAGAMIRNDSQFWTLLPGWNTIVYARSAANMGAQSIMKIRWRDTWQ